MGGTRSSWSSPPYTNGDSTELSRSFASGGWADRVVRAVQHVAGTRYGPGLSAEEVPYLEWWMAADDNFVAIRIAPKYYVAKTQRDDMIAAAISPN